MCECIWHFLLSSLCFRSQSPSLPMWLRFSLCYIVFSFVSYACFRRAKFHSSPFTDCGWKREKNRKKEPPVVRLAFFCLIFSALLIVIITFYLFIIFNWFILVWNCLRSSSPPSVARWNVSEKYPTMESQPGEHDEHCQFWFLSTLMEVH